MYGKMEAEISPAAKLEDGSELETEAEERGVVELGRRGRTEVV